MRPSKHAAALFLLSLLAGCSGSANDPGVDGSRIFATLTPDEIGRLCDFEAAQLGGYNVEKFCNMGNRMASVYSAEDHGTCVASYGEFKDAEGIRESFSLNCDASVDDFELIVRSHVACSARPGYAEAMYRMNKCGYPVTSYLGAEGQ